MSTARDLPPGSPLALLNLPQRASNQRDEIVTGEHMSGVTQHLFLRGEGKHSSSKFREDLPYHVQAGMFHTNSLAETDEEHQVHRKWEDSRKKEERLRDTTLKVPCQQRVSGGIRGVREHGKTSRRHGAGEHQVSQLL